MKVADLTLRPGTGWEKSLFSVSGNCVELAELADDTIGVRNSRDPEGDALVYTRGEIDALIMAARSGQLGRFGTNQVR